MMARPCHLALLALVAFAVAARGGEDSWTAIAVGRADYQIWKGGRELFSMETRVIGPGWTNASQNAFSRVQEGRRVYEETIGFTAGRGPSDANLEGLRFSLLGGANLKTFSGSVPNEALGAGRVTIDFVDQPAEKPVDMDALSRHWDRERRIIRANNGQIVGTIPAAAFLPSTRRRRWP